MNILNGEAGKWHAHTKKQMLCEPKKIHAVPKHTNTHTHIHTHKHTLNSDSFIHLFYIPWIFTDIELVILLI